MQPSIEWRDWKRTRKRCGCRWATQRPGSTIICFVLSILFLFLVKNLYEESARPRHFRNPSQLLYSFMTVGENRENIENIKSEDPQPMFGCCAVESFQILIFIFIVGLISFKSFTLCLAALLCLDKKKYVSCDAFAMCRYFVIVQLIPRNSVNQKTFSSPRLCSGNRQTWCSGWKVLGFATASGNGVASLGAAEVRPDHGTFICIVQTLCSRGGESVRAGQTLESSYVQSRSHHDFSSQCPAGAQIYSSTPRAWFFCSDENCFARASIVHRCDRQHKVALFQIHFTWSHYSRLCKFAGVYESETNLAHSCLQVVFLCKVLEKLLQIGDSYSWAVEIYASFNMIYATELMCKRVLSSSWCCISKTRRNQLQMDLVHGIWNSVCNYAHLGICLTNNEALLDDYSCMVVNSKGRLGVQKGIAWLNLFQKTHPRSF